MKNIPSEQLTPEHFVAAPVWSFVNNDNKGETLVRPVADIPVSDLAGCLVGVSVKLANGQKVDAMIGNVKSSKPERTKHFITLTIFHNEKKFHLARYHDPQYKREGPEALATFLDLPVQQVFPISYDLTGLSRGSVDALRGVIEFEPKLRLDREGLFNLMFG